MGLFALNVAAAFTRSALLTVLMHLLVVYVAVLANFHVASPGRVDIGIRKVIWGVVILVAALATYRAAIEVLALGEETPEGAVFRACWPGLLPATGALLTAPVVEEVLFRRLAFDHVTERFGLVSAVVITSVAFGLWHFESSAIGMVEAAIGGIILAITRALSNGIALPVVFHLLGNATTAVICIE